MKLKSYQLEDLLDRKPILLDKTSIFSQLSKKTILITGAAGSIGSEIARQVINFGPSAVILADQAETPLFLLGLEMEALSPNAMFYSELIDVTRAEATEQLFVKYKPDVVYHAAAYKHVQMMEKNPAQAVFSNISGTRIVADLAGKYGVSTFVMISTDKAVNPGNVMGASKLIAEKYINALHGKQLADNDGKIKTRYLITRFGNVLGSNGSVVPVFEKQIQEGGPVTVTHPDITRYFMTIKEACQLVLEAGAMGRGGEIYVFDMGKQVRIIDMVYKMIQMAGLRPEDDIQVRYTGLRPGEKLYEELISETSTTLPTHNKSIMIGVETAEPYDAFLVQLNDLHDIAIKGVPMDIVKKMKHIVPEFISSNSVYENLDNTK
ncbi:UDP-N-acetylglucosamine 4,6-dehydratase family protein [Flavobacterium psychrotrophum]|uniref:UDP-N-acetylglucosamine 4,6-dehydratase family protein n=1 Tax=Flavobacterium psychrotrophum TaxID=2294119 RepID=UPI000E310799|nr:polysaccharide biosynthesis protein [Flavobacterium psychrotrophum]